MKILLPEFKQYCIDTFGEAQGTKIYQFYTKTLHVDCTTSNKEYKSKESFKKNTYMPSNERRLRHLKSLCEQFSKQSIIEAMDKFMSKHNSGELSSLSMSYFAGFVRNVEAKETFQSSVVSKPVKVSFKPKSEINTPIQNNLTKKDIESPQNFAKVLPIGITSDTMYKKRFEQGKINELCFIVRCECGSEIDLGTYTGDNCPNCKGNFKFPDSDPKTWLSKD
jgi:predicted RNA binding protein with dsRBD fold (UPF0201 family)